MESYTKEIRTKDSVVFHCTCCGDCCRELEDKLMLEPLDAYNLGRHLREQGAIESIEDVYENCAHPSMLTEGCPIFLMNTVGADHSCLFLKEGRCSIYDARPHVCRIYPFSVHPGERGRKFVYHQCLDSHSHHFVGSKIYVNDWMYQNFSKEARAFLEKEAVYLTQMGQHLRKMEKETQEESLFHILFYRYYNYDLNTPFLEQYDRNQRELLDYLHRKAQRGK